MPAPLEGKVVVITGSTRGIGRAMAEACAASGATVVVSSRTASAVDEAVAALRSTGAAASGVVCDVSREVDLIALLAHALAKHGRVDVWVNNAGISLGMRKHVDTSVQEIAAIVETNLVGTMVASKLLVPYFADKGGGVLINVSGRGANGKPAPYTAGYAATKAGVSVFTASLAAEHKAEPVSILTFMPGMVDTEFYGETMEVSPGLEPLVGNIRVVLEAIGTPIARVGPALVEAACTQPGTDTGAVRRVNGGVSQMLGGFKLMWARMTGRMRSL
jgi:NAD(P)-dependent dehydrogenase (short-subunit alcohol dehydrogenase family)